MFSVRCVSARRWPDIMSCDFAVWYPSENLSDHEAGELYRRLCESEIAGVAPHPKVDAFYREITSIHPEIDDVPEEKIGNFEFSPWSCAFDRSPGHLIMSCVWPKAGEVTELVLRLGKKHGLAVYDPQSSHVTYPDEQKSWWQFWR